MFTFKPEWNDLGLYFIPSNGNYVSYFLKRSWGNYLFFPHPEIHQMYPFIIASGGIYKVFDYSLPFSFYNEELFNKFGAATIGPCIDYHPGFLIEKYNEDYSDIDLILKNEAFLLKLGKGEFVFKDLNSDFSSHDLIELPRFIEND